MQKCGKSAVCGLLVSSVSAGLSAVMNLEKKEERAECDDKCSKGEEKQMNTILQKN